MLTYPTGEQALSPFDWYRFMRQEHPVFYDQKANCWHVFRYDDVSRMLTEHATFSSDGERMLPGANTAIFSIVLMDPPRHRQLRNLVTQAFTLRAVAQLVPRISTITNELLDKVIAAGEMDVMRDLAAPMPVIVIAELLGVAVENRESFKRWSDALAERDENEDEQEYLQTNIQKIEEMNQYFMQVLEQRRQRPQDDLISGLLASKVDGQHLSHSEILGFCVLLLIAGNLTTVNLIGNAILCFDEHPDVMELLRNDPALMPSAVEEILRYYAPVKSIDRITTTETTIGEQHIGANQFIKAWIGSANHDETRFSNPECFDIQREPNRHLAFGHGIHFCLGAPLARLEAKVALNTMLERMSEIRRVPNVALEPLNSPVLLGVKKLPITFKRL
jgi:cytochrome P450